MRESQRLITNGFAVFCQMAVMMAIGLVLPPFVIHQVGDKSYGVVVVIGSILTAVTLIQMGIPTALSRYVAVAMAKKDNAELSRVMSSGMAFLVVCAGIGLPVVGLFVLAPELLLSWPAQISRQTVQAMICVMGLLSILSIPLSFGHMAFVGRERFVLYAMLQTGGSVLRFGMVYGLLLVFPGNILVYAASNSGSIALHAAIVFLLAIHVFKDGQLALRWVHPATLWRMLKYGLVVMLGNMALLLYIQADYFIIGKLIDSAAVTMFSLALAWPLVLRTVLRAVVSVISPAAARTEASGAQAALSMMLKRAAKYGLLAGSAPLVFLYVYRHDLMNVWMGPGYGEAASLMPPILLADLLSFGVAGGAEMLVGMGRVRVPLIIDFAGGVINIAVALFLTGYLGMGVMGFSLAYAAVLIVRNGIAMPLYFMREFHMGALDYVGKCYGRSLLCVAAIVPCVYFIREGLPGRNWPGIVLAAAATLAAFIPLVALIGMDQYDRDVFRQLMTGMVRRLRRN